MTVTGAKDRQGRTDGPVAILDDDTGFREALAAALLSLGYAVLDFGTADALFALLGQLLPACLILDVDLPDMTGLEVQAVLRQQGRAVPLIFLSASEDPQVRAQALERGAVEFLNKPARIDDLDALIARTIGRSD